MFTPDELITAANKLKKGRTPGMDGIPAEAVQTAVNAIGNYVLKVINHLWSEGKFPDSWKQTRLVLIDKPKKNPDAERTYRPLFIINTLAKLYENMIVT